MHLYRENKFQLCQPPTPKSNGNRNERKNPSYVSIDKVLCHIGNILWFKLKLRAQHAPESQYVSHVQLKTSLAIERPANRDWACQT